jgi:hypothetical protein
MKAGAVRFILLTFVLIKAKKNGYGGCEKYRNKQTGRKFRAV